MSNARLSAELFVEQLHAAFDDGLSVRFTPSGVSMLPTIIGDSDIVTLSPPDEIRCYDVVLFCRPSGELVLHRVIGIRDDCLTISGDNQYTIERITREDVIAVMTALTHKEREIDLDGVRYRLRVRFLMIKKHLRRFASRCVRVFRRKRS